MVTKKRCYIKQQNLLQLLVKLTSICGEEKEEEQKE